MNFFGLFRTKVKKIAFLDGDQPLPGIIDAHAKYLKGVETHLVRAMTDSNEPKILRKTVGINKIYLSGFTGKKEITDKFIAGYIQKSVTEGYKDITVVSSDYDFIDIFKLCIQLEPKAANITFRIIIPDAKGRVNDAQSVGNIEVVRI